MKYFVYRGSQYTLQTDALTAPNWQERTRNDDGLYTTGRPDWSLVGPSHLQNKFCRSRLQTYKYLCVNLVPGIGKYGLLFDTPPTLKGLYLPEY